MTSKHVIALVGMPGSGKSQAAVFFKDKGLSVIRFGDLTDEMMREKGLKPTPESERIVREELRRDLGMAAYAVSAKPKIEEVLKDREIVVLDGLYSWEEYIFLKEYFPSLLILSIFASPKTRYERLAVRKVRPLSAKEAGQRDVFEIENINKGGPIAMADYVIVNEGTVEDLHRELGKFLNKI